MNAEQRVIREMRRMRKIVTIALELDKWLAWYEYVTLSGYSLSQRSNGWLLVVKAEKQGKPVVAFKGGHSPWDCWDSFLMGIHRGDLQWKVDKFRTD